MEFLENLRSIKSHFGEDEPCLAYVLNHIKKTCFEIILHEKSSVYWKLIGIKETLSPATQDIWI